MSIATSDTRTGSLAVLMDNLVSLEKEIDPRLKVYRWQPRNIEPPAIWNWMLPGGYENKDLQRHRDNLVISVRLGINHTDVDSEMALLEEMIDKVRDTIDPALWAPRPLGAVRAQRTDIRSALWEFWEGIPMLGAEFPIAFAVDRNFSPNQ